MRHIMQWSAIPLLLNLWTHVQGDMLYATAEDILALAVLYRDRLALRGIHSRNLVNFISLTSSAINRGEIS